MPPVPPVADRTPDEIASPVPTITPPRLVLVAAGNVNEPAPPAPVAPVAPAGIVKSRLTPPDTVLAFTAAELPAAPVVTVPIVMAGVVPSLPSLPAGMPNASDTFPPLVVAVTVALLPADSVVVLPTLTVDAGPAGMPKSITAL